MSRIGQGCEASFGELYDRYGERMHRYFYRMLGSDAHRAEDFAQELFLKLLEKNASYDPERKFSSWLYAVAGNMVKNEYRRQSRQVEPTSSEDFFGEDFSETIDNQLFAKQLGEALNDMEAHHRECFILRYQEELSVREIAELLDCPEGTVKSRTFYALRKLGQRLRSFAVW